MNEKDLETQARLVRYFQELQRAEEKESFCVFGEFRSKLRLPNGYTVKVIIKEPKKRVSHGK